MRDRSMRDRPRQIATKELARRAVLDRLWLRTVQLDHLTEAATANGYPLRALLYAAMGARVSGRYLREASGGDRAL